MRTEANAAARNPHARTFPVTSYELKVRAVAALHM